MRQKFMRQTGLVLSELFPKCANPVRRTIPQDSNTVLSALVQPAR
jgi:hypothetical protein